MLFFPILGSESDWRNLFSEIATCQDRYSVDATTLFLYCPIDQHCRDCMVDLIINKLIFFLYMGITFVVLIAVAMYARDQLAESIRTWNIETAPYPIILFGMVIVFGLYLMSYGNTDHILTIIAISFLFGVIAMASIFLAKLIKFRKSKYHAVSDDSDQNNDAQNNFYDDYEDIVGTANILPNHYVTLHISENATFQEIRKSYVNLVKKTHPDKPGGNHDAMVRLTKAYEILSDTNKRAMYDEIRRITKK